MLEVPDVSMVVWWVRIIFILSVKVGCGIVALELGELVVAYASDLFEGMGSKPCETSLDILEIVVGAEEIGCVNILGNHRVVFV